MLNRLLLVENIQGFDFKVLRNFEIFKELVLFLICFDAWDKGGVGILRWLDNAPGPQT